MFLIIECTKTSLIEVCRVRTIEEAYDMLKKWMDYKPSSLFQIMESWYEHISRTTYNFHMGIGFRGLINFNKL